MMKKRKKTAHFSSLLRTIVDEEGKEREETLEKQSDKKDEVCAYYEKLYKGRELLSTQEKK